MYHGRDSLRKFVQRLITELTSQHDCEVHHFPGLLSCADLKTAQRISNGLSAEKIDRFFRNWLARLLHPFSTADRRAGYRYDVRRLRLRGIIERIAGTHCYQLAKPGLQTALFSARVYQRVLRPGLSLLQEHRLREGSPLARSFHAFPTELDHYFQLQLPA